MLLNEFFGRAIKAGKQQDKKHTDQDEKNDDLFWYLIDHDKLHKDFFLPIAQKIKKEHASNKLDKESCIMEFMPMVNKGCMEYYKHKKLNGKLGKVFPKKIREELCEKMYDHYCEDILNDNYSLGI
jgi:hypothetical protein